MNDGKVMYGMERDGFSQCLYGEWSTCLCPRCQDHVMGCHARSISHVTNKAEQSLSSAPEFIFSSHSY